MTWPIFCLTTVAGGCGCAIAQCRMALTAAVPDMARPVKPTRPPIATRATPIIMALEFAGLIFIPDASGLLLLMITPDGS